MPSHSQPPPQLLCTGLARCPLPRAGPARTPPLGRTGAPRPRGLRAGNGFVPRRRAVEPDRGEVPVPGGRRPARRRLRVPSPPLTAPACPAAAAARIRPGPAWPRRADAAPAGRAGSGRAEGSAARARPPTRPSLAKAGPARCPRSASAVRVLLGSESRCVCKCRCLQRSSRVRSSAAAPGPAGGRIPAEAAGS